MTFLETSKKDKGTLRDIHHTERVLFVHVATCLFRTKRIITFVPSVFMATVHPPSPHPKFPMWQ